MNIVDTFIKGGFIMYPLTLFSILIWTVAIQKYLFLRGFRRQYRGIYDNSMMAITTGKVADLKWIVKNASKLVSYPHEVIFEEWTDDKKEMQEMLDRRLGDTGMELRSGLWILGTIGSSAPFVGLFGTVIGIMQSFHSISETGKSGFNVVAAGMSEALIATASGIIVAVIAVIFYNYFQVRIQAITLDFRHKVEELGQLIYLEKGKKGKNS